MQSHRDDDFKHRDIIEKALAEDRRTDAERFQRMMDELRARADRMTEEGANRITAGAKGEEFLFERNVPGFGVVRQLPDDPACLRISIGEIENPPKGEDVAYLTFRGHPARIEALLVMALQAFRDRLNVEA